MLALLFVGLAKPKRNKNEDHLSADETVVEKVKVLRSSS
jgi:hypothetical protein